MSSEFLTVSPVARRNPWLNAKLLIASAAVVLAVGFLVYNAMGSSMAYFQTVGELRASGKDVTGDPVRVGGDVVSGSIERESMSGAMRFVISDGTSTLPVVYDGVVPDIFNDHAQVVVEGQVGPDGTLQASKLLTKCPSRFESADSAS